MQKKKKKIIIKQQKKIIMEPANCLSRFIANPLFPFCGGKTVLIYSAPAVVSVRRPRLRRLNAPWVKCSVRWSNAP